jgi:hypothetical protein
MMIDPQHINQIADSFNATAGLINSIGAIFISLASAIGSASIVAAFLPPPNQPGIFAKIHKCINTLALNKYYAKDGDASAENK